MTAQTRSLSFTRLVVGTSFLVSLAASAHAQISVASSTNFPTGTTPDGAAIGDFTGDGVPDIAVTIDGPDRIQILVGDGTGSFAAGATFALGPNAGGGDVLAVDIDGDTDMDLVACRQNQLSVAVFRNTGGGAFTLVGNFATGDKCQSPRAGDIDGDGDMDLAVANNNDDTITVLTNLAGVSFSSTTFATGPDVRGVAFGKLDADGDLDLAATAHDDRTVRLFSNDGAGSFSPMATLNVPAVARPDGIDIADLSGDGLADIAVASSGNVGSFATVFLRAGASFAAPINYPVSGANGSFIVIAEFECDTDLDIAIADPQSNLMSIIGNTGLGAFGPATVVPTGTQPTAIAAADLDADNDRDLVVTNNSSNNVTVTEMGCGAGFDPSDLNHDGVVNSADLGILLGAWGTAGADLNADGNTDAADLAVLLGSWS